MDRSNPLHLGLRAAQGLFAVIILGLTAYAAHVISFGGWDTNNFMLFNSVWTLFIVVPFMLLVPIYFPSAAHPFVLAGLDAVTMIFWFAGFIAMGSRLPGPKYCNWNVCRALQAATVFGSFEWALFVVAVVLTVLPVVRSRGRGKPGTEGVAPAV